MVRALILILSLGIPLFAQQSCPATGDNSAVRFTPPAPYGVSSFAQGFWYGTPALWTRIDSGPMHTADPGNLSAKLVYWRAGFDWKAEPQPDLKVIAKRLDFPAPLIEAPMAHAVRFSEEGLPEDMAMMAGIRFPEPGCWQIVATYKGIHTLSYIAWVVR